MMRLVLVIVYLTLAHWADGQPIVETEYGTVEGNTVTVNNGFVVTDVNSFQNIPFAAPPVGTLRFMRTQKHPGYPPEGIKAKKLGHMCPQQIVGPTWMTHPFWTDYDEDCLNLNIFAPSVGSAFPVMVWFYGGGYTTGGNLNYPGYFLAAHDVVLVVVNYRIGNLGFAYSGGDGVVEGNAGMWDQVTGLRYVRDNIENFGGDPNKVTVFGQSAGSASTSLHMVSSVSKDLFHQAIMLSGTESNMWTLNWPAQNSVNYLHAIANEWDCDSMDHVAMVACLQDVPAMNLSLTAFNCTPGHLCQGMAPVVDGPGGFLEDLPQNLRASGNIMRGPIMTGSTSDDGSLYTSMLIPESDDAPFNRTYGQEKLKSNLLSIWAPLWDNVTQEDTFQAMDWKYSPWPYVNEADYRLVINKLITDVAFVAATDRQALDQSNYNDVYHYVFGYRGQETYNVFPEWMGVPHMADLPYVFGYPMFALEGNEGLRNDSGIHIDIVDWTDQDLAYAQFWCTLVANFAKYGDPTPTPVVAPSPDSPFIKWEPYVDETRNYFFMNNETAYVDQLYRPRGVAFWNEYFSGYLKGDVPIPVTSGNGGGLSSQWYDRGMQQIILQAMEYNGVDVSDFDMPCCNNNPYY